MDAARDDVFIDEISFPATDGCFSDDPWATRPAVELLTSGFTGIKPEVLTVKPSDVDAKAIGHFGFFRPEHRDTLWRGVAQRIQGNKGHGWLRAFILRCLGQRLRPEILRRSAIRFARAR